MDWDEFVVRGEVCGLFEDLTAKQVREQISLSMQEGQHRHIINVCWKCLERVLGLSWRIFNTVYGEGWEKTAETRATKTLLLKILQTDFKEKSLEDFL